MSIARTFSLVNLDDLARASLEGESVTPSPFLDPARCQELVDSYHAKLASRLEIPARQAWSFGGYLEDRSLLWRGSYLEETGSFVHAGIDVNVPRGTPVRATHAAKVLLVDNDCDLDGGWGPRIVLEPLVADSAEAVAVMYAHLLEEPAYDVDSIISSGQVIGKVGCAPTNGNWYDHVHIQAVKLSCFEFLQATGQLDRLDGYFPRAAMLEFMRLYPDPISYMPFEWEL